MVDRARLSLIASPRATLLVAKVGIRNMASAQSTLWTAVEVTDVLPHHMARDVAHMLSGLVQPAKEVGESSRIGV
jgi:hypothetical protein